MKRIVFNVIKKLSGPKIDGRHTAKIDESKRVKWICDNINNNTELGLKIKTKYTELFKKDISNVIFKGTNGRHYDILITNTDGSLKKCEEKGSKKYRKIETMKKPWENSVQIYNGPGNKFSIGRKYARFWYDNVVCDTAIKEKYNIEYTIPTFEDWETDAYSCGDPKTQYGRALKKTYREIHPNSSLGGKGNSSYDYRLNVNNKFILAFSDKEKKTMINEIQEKMNAILVEKECWLQTTGEIDQDFNFKWYNKIEVPVIQDITILYKKGSDITFNITTDSPFIMKGIIRFGKGTGFSNIRVDIKLN